MKKIKNIFLPLVVSVLFFNCSGSKITTYPSQEIALPNSEEGTILIRSSGQGGKEADAVRSAEIRAFKTLLFYGLPSSVQTRPMIENESESRKSHALFYNNFFEKNGYRDFILSSATYSNSQSAGKYIYLNRDIKINLRSLRTHLENKGIIRKFGY